MSKATGRLAPDGQQTYLHSSQIRRRELTFWIAQRVSSSRITFDGPRISAMVAKDNAVVRGSGLTVKCPVLHHGFAVCWLGDDGFNVTWHGQIYVVIAVNSGVARNGRMVRPSMAKEEQGRWIFAHAHLHL